MTALVLEPEHYIGDAIHGFEVRPEIAEWCNANLKSVWKPLNDFKTQAPYDFDYEYGEGDRACFTINIMVIQPAIEFEDENELVHFKMRWFG